MLNPCSSPKTQTKNAPTLLFSSIRLKREFLWFDSLHIRLGDYKDVGNSELLYYKTVALLKNLEADANIKMQEFSILYCILYNR